MLGNDLADGLRTLNAAWLLMCVLGRRIENFVCAGVCHAAVAVAAAAVMQCQGRGRIVTHPAVAFGLENVT